MTRVKCEGVKLRIDDVWAGDENGKAYYLDLTDPEKAVMELAEAPTLDKLYSFRLQYEINGLMDNSGVLKDTIIEAAITVLEKMKSEGKRPKGRTRELVSQMTGISPCYINIYNKNRNRKKRKEPDFTPEELNRRDAVHQMNRIRLHMRYLLEHLDTYQWEEFLRTLGPERELAEELIMKLQKTIVEGDERMKKISVDYTLEDNQVNYLEKIHRHYPDIDEEVLFLMIMYEGSALDIDRKLRDFCKAKGIHVDYGYSA